MVKYILDFGDGTGCTRDAALMLLRKGFGGFGIYPLKGHKNMAEMISDGCMPPDCISELEKNKIGVREEKEN